MGGKKTAKLTVERVSRAVASEAPGEPVPRKRVARPLRPGQCKDYLRKTVAAAYRDIVAGFVEQAKSGSCQHLKVANEIVESEGFEQTKIVAVEKGPAELLLEKLGGGLER